MRILLTFLFLTIPSMCFAQAHDYRISDNDGNVAVLTSNGFTMTSTNDSTNTYKTPVAHDRRISDNDGNVMSINSDGSLNIQIIG